MKTALPIIGLALSACSYDGPSQSVSGMPPPLAERHDMPRLAMLEHILGTHFGSGTTGRPLVCASWHDGREEEALPPEEERELMIRFPLLSPMARCSRRSDGWIDSETGEPALVFTVHNFTCASVDACSAWGGYRSNGANSRSALYRGDWTGSHWHFTQDSRTTGQ